MRNLSDMLWVEWRKATRSRLPIWTTLASLFMPAGVAFLVFLAKNPQLSQGLGLVSAKANLIAYSATDWASYLVFFAEIVVVGGFFFFVLAISWVFGREFADGTLKDILAVPVPRSSILLAKFIVVIAWSAIVAIMISVFGLVVGVLIHLPGGSPGVIIQGSLTVVVATCLGIAVVLPFALLASVGRGYLLPLGAAVLVLITANLVVIVGWGEYFPWAVPMLYAQGESSLSPASYGIVVLTALAGMVATYLWWKYADQNR